MVGNLGSVIEQIKQLSPEETIILFKLIDKHPLKRHPGFWIAIGLVFGILYMFLNFEIRYYCIKKRDIEINRKSR